MNRTSFIHSPHQSGGGKHAFTLVELLVVITIIGILASVGFGAYNLVIENARATEDLNNVKQLATAVNAYAADNDGYLDLFAPGGGGGGGGGGEASTWPAILREDYVKNNKVFKSGFDRRPQNNDLTAGSAPVSYGVNSNFTSEVVFMDDVQNPSKLILFAPSRVSGGGGGTREFDGTFETNPTTSPTNVGDQGTHGKSKQRIVFAALDAHAENVRVSEINSNADAQELEQLWQVVEQE